MSPTEAIKHFSTARELARVLGVTEGAVSQWKLAGTIPAGRQYQLQVLTGGRLTADPPAPRGETSAA